MDRCLISEIKIENRFREELGDIQSLADSIGKVGLLHSIVITSDNVLIAGLRRLEACKLLNWGHIPVRVLDLENDIEAACDENEQRKDFTPSENVAVWRALESRQGQSSGKLPTLRSEVDRSESPRQKAARITGKSTDTLSRARQVVEAAEAEPETYTPLVEEMDRTGKVKGAYKKLKTAQQVEEIAKEPSPLPNGPFRVIVIDPPWSYRKRPNDPTHRAANPYPSMPIEEIKELPISDLAENDCILWLWTTNAHMREAFDVLDAWGFTHKTILTWVKNRMGLGDWLRGKTEHCLMAVKGKPVVDLTNQTTVIDGLVREHSRKPDEFYEMVEKLCPGSKVELFARNKREGWIPYGDQTELFSRD